MSERDRNAQADSGNGASDADISPAGRVGLLDVAFSRINYGFGAMVIVGLPYSFQGQTTLDEIVGCSPYGASTIAGSQGQRAPSAIELDGARYQGKLIAETANKLFGQ